MTSTLRVNGTAIKAGPLLFRCLIERRRPAPVELRQLFESLGVTYIKLGQLIASTPTLFPKEYVQAFEGCFDSVPPLPFKTIEKLLGEELECNPYDLFESIEKECIASASIAQVHRAKLATGEAVVVKVQKPNVERIIQTDLTNVYIVARLLELVSPVLTESAATDLVVELHRSMIAECDFLKEQQNINDFRQFLSGKHVQSVIAPKTFPLLTSKKLLVMEEIRGWNLASKEVDKHFSEFELKTKMMEALAVWMSSVQDAKSFHADLHAGNIMFTPHGEVAFIDFGMVGVIDESIWQASKTLYEGLFVGDVEMVAGAMITIGLTKKKVDRDQLVKDINKLIASTKTIDGLLDPINMGVDAGSDWSSPASGDGIETLINDLVSIARRNGLRFPAAFTLLLKQFFYFDAYINRFDIETSIIEQFAQLNS